MDGMDDPGHAVAETRTAARRFDLAVQREFAKRKLVMAWVWYGGLPLALLSWGVSFGSGHGSIARNLGPFSTNDVALVVFFGVIAIEAVMTFAYYRCPACGASLYARAGRGWMPLFDSTICPNCGVTLQ